MSYTPPKAGGFFGRLKEAVRGTRKQLAERIEEALLGRKEVSPELLEDLEAVLLGADLGAPTASTVIERTRERLERKQLQDSGQLRDAICQELVAMISARQTAPAAPGLVTAGPRVVFVVGVNGTGKTTTVGKLANFHRAAGRTVLIAAADTFRAAAVEQLAIWAERSGTQLVTATNTANPSAVIYDALEEAVTRSADLVLVDTAGRLHTRGNLMQELDKMKRIAARKVEGAPHEVLLVLDATTGQNGLVQAREFTRAAGVTGLVVTKLDGTAKGGIVFSIVHELKIPVRFVGIGEKIDDLAEFSAGDFVRSIFEA